MAILLPKFGITVMSSEKDTIIGIVSDPESQKKFFMSSLGDNTHYLLLDDDSEWLVTSFRGMKNFAEVRFERAAQ